MAKNINGVCGAFSRIPTTILSKLIKLHCYCRIPLVHFLTVKSSPLLLATSLYNEISIFAKQRIDLGYV